MFVRSVSASQRRTASYVPGVKDYGSIKDDHFTSTKEGSIHTRSSRHPSRGSETLDVIEFRRRKALGRSDYWYSPRQKQRIKIYVCGKLFETYESTLNFDPETLLGNKLFREHFYDHKIHAYKFDDRCFYCFDAILFYYQSHGILRKPNDVKRYKFMEELNFFKIHKFFDKRHKDETTFLRKIEKRQEDIDFSHSPIKENIFRILQFENSSNIQKIFSLLYFTFVLFSVALLCFDARSEVIPIELWLTFETISTVVFTVEFILQLSFTSSKKRYLCSSHGVIDLGTIAPYYFDIVVFGITNDWTFHYVVQFSKTIRLLKFMKVHKRLKLLLTIIQDSIHYLILLFISVGMASLSFAALTYFFEQVNHTEQNEQAFNSIFDALWFSVITATGVGYGDVYPHTLYGKLCGGLLAIFGVLLFCIPATKLVNKFVECYYLPDVLSDDDCSLRKRIINSMRENFLQK